MGGQTIAVPIVMKRASARLRGEVVDGLDQPVFDATVVASGNGSVVECETDMSGAFAVQLEAGLWEVHAEKAGYASSEAETVGLSAGEYAELPHGLVVTGTPGTVTGNVLNQAGTPIIGATVWARNGEALCPATTNASGRFSVTLAPGTWLAVGGEDGIPTEQRANGRHRSGGEHDRESSHLPRPRGLGDHGAGH